MKPTEAVYDFLGDLYRNPDLAHKLLAEIMARTFVELDEEPCLEAERPLRERSYEQGRLM